MINSYHRAISAFVFEVIAYAGHMTSHPAIVIGNPKLLLYLFSAFFDDIAT